MALGMAPPMCRCHHQPGIKLRLCTCVVSFILHPSFKSRDHHLCFTEEETEAGEAEPNQLIGCSEICHLTPVRCSVHPQETVYSSRDAGWTGASWQHQYQDYVFDVANSSQLMFPKQPQADTTDLCWGSPEMPADLSIH